MFAETASDSTFEEKVLKSSKPVLVDFFAPWCGPCRALSPVVDEIASEANGRYEVYKVNVDESPRTAAELGIRSVPTLMVFKNGTNLQQTTGAVQKDKILAMLEAALA